MRTQSVELCSVRKMVALCLSAAVALVGSPILLWDAVLADRLPRLECRVYGSGADQLGVDSGSAVQADSGPCLDSYRCAEETRVVSRILLPDSRTRQSTVSLSGDEC